MPAQPKTKRKRTRKRLKDVQSFEVAGVRKGANGGRYLIAKEDGSMRLDLNKLTELYSSLGKVITVCKSGTPAAETVEALGKDLGQIHATLTGLLADGAAPDSFDPVGVKTRVDGIKELAESLSGSTHDLNVQDQLDSLLEQVKELEEQLQAVPQPAQAAAEPEEEAQPEADASAQEATADAEVQADAATAAAADAEPAAADAATAAAAPEATPDTAADAAATPEAAADAAPEAAPEASAEVVTKADLTASIAALGQSLGDAMKDALTQMQTVVKSANPRGVLLPGGAGGDAHTTTAPKDDPDAYDETHWGNSFDLLSDN